MTLLGFSPWDARRISTHTPLAGRDDSTADIHQGREQFLLTRPLRDVTATITAACLVDSISTHTPLAGRDESS